MMPHVDEGTLHALLDGALRADRPDEAARVEDHLAGCEDCRARLEAARVVRDRASDLLAAAALDAVPDFADVRARARESAAADAGAEGRVARPERGRYLRQQLWTRRLGWAASLVLALGTGYLIRDLADPAAPSASGVTRAPAAVEARDSEDGAPVPTPAAASDDVPEADPAPAPRPAEDPMAGSRPEDGPMRTAGEVEAGAEPDVTEAEAPAARVEGERLELAEEAALRQRAVDQEPALPAPEPTRVPADEAPMRLEARRLAPTAVSADRVSADRALARDSTWVAGMAAAESAPEPIQWTPASVQAARDAMGGALYRLPGARILEVYVASGPRVLTLQRLDSGASVRVLQSPSALAPVGARAAAPAELAPLGPGEEWVEVRRDNVVLELMAPLPAAVLVALAETAEPAP